MTCPKCGGTVGPHSDLCLDCDYDAKRFDKVVSFAMG